MQRLSNTLLLTMTVVFVMAVTLALLVASWLMAAYLLRGSTFPALPKWLFVVGFLLTAEQVNAQTKSEEGWLVIEEQSLLPNGQRIVSFSLTTAPDSLLLPVRGVNSVTKQVLNAWPA